MHNFLDNTTSINNPASMFIDANCSFINANDSSLTPNLVSLTPNFSWVFESPPEPEPF